MSFHEYKTLVEKKILVILTIICVLPRLYKINAINKELEKVFNN